VNLGNKAAAKEQFETLRRLLERELGVEPGAETRKLYKELMG
jgi:DNA-binding SARP family transcriptional activator